MFLNNSLMEQMFKDAKILYLILFDIYWLRYKKSGDQWYELTDYLRKKLEEDKIKIRFTKDDLVFNGQVYDEENRKIVKISGSIKELTKKFERN